MATMSYWKLTIKINFKSTRSTSLMKTRAKRTLMEVQGTLKFVNAFQFLMCFSDVLSTQAPDVLFTITKTLEFMTHRTNFLKWSAILRSNLSSKISAKDSNSLSTN